MKVSQKRAILYKERERKIEKVKEAGLWEGFEKSGYKYLECYLKSIGKRF